MEAAPNKLRYEKFKCVSCKQKGVLAEQPSNPHWLECSSCDRLQPNPLNNNYYFPAGNLLNWL